MAYIQGCYIDQCGTPTNGGYAEVTLVAGEGAVYQVSGKETSIGQHPTRYGITGTGCWQSCNLIHNDLISPPGSFYQVVVYVGGKRLEAFVVKLDAQTPTGTPVDVKTIGQRINNTI